LLHECAHVEKHLLDEGLIIDETESSTGAFGNDPGMENETNTLALSALLPDDIRDEIFRVVKNISKAKMQFYIRKADVHETVIPAKVRMMTGQHTHFAEMVGKG
jgi:hypothetical protein